MPQRDRRQFTRQPINLPVKIQVQATGRYLAGQAVDASAGGLLIRLTAGHALPAGTTIRVGLATHPEQAVITARHMQPATICRSMGHGQGRYLAVAFEQPIQLALSA